MRVLALEPFYGGSHQSFLDHWIERSRHDWTLLSLPAYKWKWRMRHAPLTFAKQLFSRSELHCDVVVASDMLDVAAWRGLVPERFGRLPLLVYFHENQLTYPVRDPRERDLHFGLTNIISAHAADAVWFNSSFHRDSFLDAARQLTLRMPDFRPTDAIDRIAANSEVHPPGLPGTIVPGRPPERPVHIVWAARWEHDKNPEMFFTALRRLKRENAQFRLSVIGEQFDDSPACFDAARREFSGHMVRWGYQPGRAEYERALAEADLFVSTADHEFFGIAAGEAILAGCRPLLPDRLAYPDLLGSLDEEMRREVFYDGSLDGLVKRLYQLTAPQCDGTRWSSVVQRCQESIRPLQWELCATEYDTLLANIVGAKGEA